ncbi:hypothetical protein [Flavobacterium sp. SORGH_AS_0622]|uniref:hypothetical protein n=1 Tax=Flavobacterium sp. SORGH_AS_0622 TaxID=3041772 RepID=UPI002787D5D4|nr:hypothetical protein [Flavobacterium sp. SORGH_AS_0622]MDQ1164881.1 hypothetical protein [Flavobacterium sp. SORGH_AS_0622]
MNEFYNQFELHYYFSDNSHGFDAIIRNECEKELLLLFEEIINDLDIKIAIEAKPPQNGGFIEIWEFIGTNKETITLIVSIITLILSRIPVQNRKLTKLQIENLELDNQLKREELKKLGIKNVDKIDENLLKKITDFLIKNYKIFWRRSNFFKKITQYKRINKITVNKLLNYHPSSEIKTLRLGDFEQFILFDENIPDIVDQTEIIDLISSALKQGKFKWKGFLNSQIIDFEMQDENFKQHVFHGDIKHTNKVRLKVKLNFSRKIDETGRIKITRYYVTNVLNYYIDNIEYEV